MLSLEEYKKIVDDKQTLLLSVTSEVYGDRVLVVVKYDKSTDQPVWVEKRAVFRYGEWNIQSTSFGHRGEHYAKICSALDTYTDIEYVILSDKEIDSDWSQNFLYHYVGKHKPEYLI